MLQLTFTDLSALCHFATQMELEASTNDISMAAVPSRDTEAKGCK
jgi:hypothetical protein